MLDKTVKSSKLYLTKIYIANFNRKLKSSMTFLWEFFYAK